MSIHRHSRPRRAARVPVVVAVFLAATVAMVVGAGSAGASSAAAADDPAGATIAIGAHGARAVDQTVFRLEGIRPGDQYAFPVHLRNDSAQDVEVTFEGLDYQDVDSPSPVSTDNLRHYTTLTLENAGVVIGRGAADSRTLAGARVYLPAGTTQRLRSELTMPAGVGNAAQGTSLDVVYHFSIAHASGSTIDTGTASGPDAAGSAGHGGPGYAYDGGLPPTGESLFTFHLMVWAALGAFTALLATLFLAAIRRHVDNARRSSR